MKIALTIVLNGKRHRVNVSVAQLTRHGIRGLCAAVLQRLSDWLHLGASRVHVYSQKLEGKAQS